MPKLAPPIIGAKWCRNVANRQAVPERHTVLAAYFRVAEVLWDASRR